MDTKVFIMLITYYIVAKCFARYNLLPCQDLQKNNQASDNMFINGYTGYNQVQNGIYYTSIFRPRKSLFPKAIP